MTSNAMLAPAPSSLFESGTSSSPASRRPRFGVSAGRLPAFPSSDLGAGERLARRKKWLFYAVVTEELLASFAVLRTGYAATAFAWVQDRREKRLIADVTRLVPSPSSFVADDAGASGPLVTLGDRVKVRREGSDTHVDLRIGDLALDMVADESTPAPRLAVIADLSAEGGPGAFGSTEKRMLLPARGSLRVGERAFSLDGGTAAYDYSHGLLPRHTKWRWGFGLAPDASFGFNLTSGFVGARECVVFAPDGITPVGEPSFAFDRARPEDACKLQGDGVDLVFTPGGVHRQETKLVVIRSRFFQIAGTFDGTIGGRAVADMPGVLEDQDVLW